MIAEHPSELVRDQYVMQVADRCRLDPDQLRARLRAPRAVRVAPERAPVGATRVWLPDSPEVNALLALIHAPHAVDEVLMQDPELTESMFTDLKNLAAFRALASTATIEAAIAAADPGAADLLLQLSVADFDGDADDAVASLVRAAARRAIASSTTPIDPQVHEALLDVNEPVSRWRSHSAVANVASFTERGIGMTDSNTALRRVVVPEAELAVLVRRSRARGAC